jgi:ABC-2 type transport system ATP-binding protein
MTETETETGRALEPALRIWKMAYAYKKHQALQDVTFSVDQGSIHGFVGPNGAGKTTTLKIIATLLRPQQGRIRVLGLNLSMDFKAIRRKIGFMPDHFSMYQRMTVFEYLDFFAAAYGMGLAERDRVIGSVLALTEMESRQHDLIDGLSRGLKQRVNLARVLIHDPELVLLDEPASGLDPRARIELMEILKELSRLGKTIIISSHILSELADLCDSLTIIDRGAVKYSGSMRSLLSHTSGLSVYLLDLAEPHPSILGVLQQLGGMSQVEQLEQPASYRLSFDKEQLDTNTVLQTVLECGGRIESFTIDSKQLGHAFLSLTEPGVPA